jgi:hypothetical protein
MKVTLNPQGIAQVRDRIRQAIEEASLAAAEQLDENTSAGSRSGRQYPRLPRRSSAPGEYPQEQFGNLNDSIDVRDGEHDLQKRPGFYGENQGKLIGLEFKPASKGGRKPAMRTMESPETHQRMRDAAGKVKR